MNAGIAKQVLEAKGFLRLAARDIFHTQYNRYLINFIQYATCAFQITPRF